MEKQKNKTKRKAISVLYNLGLQNIGSYRLLINLLIPKNKKRNHQIWLQLSHKFKPNYCVDEQSITFHQTPHNYLFNV